MPNNSGNTNGNRKLEPYMLYGDRSTAGKPMIKEDPMVKDLEYLQGLYPVHMKALHEYVVSACDHLDYKNSPMYDEFPDRVLINQVCDSVCRQLCEDGVVSEDQFMEVREMDQEAAEKKEPERMAWEEEDDQLIQQSPSWGPPPGPNRPCCPPPGPRPPWGPPPGPNPPWGPPLGPRPPWGPPPGPNPPWGPPPGPRPPWGPPPGPNPPWGPPPGPRPGGRPSQGGGRNWLNDIISIILINEMHRRRCRNGFCK